MREGFYTALGTPFDENSNFIENSFRKQIDDQITAGASGLLVMGSMGIAPYIKDSEYFQIAKVGSESAKGLCPVLVGVIDNSIARVLQRIDGLKGLKIDGVISTTPFYYMLSQDEVINFYEKIASHSPFPLYAYDLPSVTKTKINLSTAEYLMAKKIIKGIKTSDISTARGLLYSQSRSGDFDILYSGLDSFDVAYKYGLNLNLDGMFSCTAKLATKFYHSMRENDFDEAGKHLNKILTLRNIFVDVGVFRGFSYAMNLLGYEGIFSPDYAAGYHENELIKIKDYMKEIDIL